MGRRLHGVRFVRVIGALLAILVSGPTPAHHSQAPFNMDGLLAFEGTVIRYRWRNPHVYITVKDRNGAEWLVETDATPVMSRSGWTRDSFAPGDAVTVRIRPDRNPSKHHGLLVSIAGDDGIPMASHNRGDEEGIEIVGASTTSLAGVWAARRLEAFKVFPPAADIAVTAAGAEGRRQYDESQNPLAECIPPPSPNFMWLPWIYLAEIELGDDAIVIRSEFYGAERTIYMDGRDHPENGQRTVQGHSIGHWEGDTLVIDSTLFADFRSSIPSTGIPSGEKKHLAERMTLSDDGQTALYEFVVEDADYLAEPLSGEYTWHFVPHLEFISLECELDNARRFIE
jgi:hypothetical protein